MSIRSILFTISTCGSVGYKRAPGTAASVLYGLPASIVWHLLMRNMPFYIEIGALCIVSALAIACIRYGVPQIAHHHDPSYVVLDEVIGCLWTFVGVGTFNFLIAGAGIILFRIYDIFKFPPISYAEQLPGAYGIVADDILAGICARVMLFILYSV